MRSGAHAPPRFPARTAGAHGPNVRLSAGPRPLRPRAIVGYGGPSGEKTRLVQTHGDGLVAAPRDRRFVFSLSCRHASLAARALRAARAPALRARRTTEEFHVKRHSGGRAPADLAAPS